MSERRHIRTGQMTGRGACAAALLLGCAVCAGAAEELTPLRVAVHVDTSVSHHTRRIKLAGITVRKTPGAFPASMEEVARMARERGLDAIVLADRARADVSYGLTRFSRLFKVTVTEGSIADWGGEQYLRRAREAAETYGVIIIPGAECVPYYRWRGSAPGSLGGPGERLALRHLYEHMVLVGLDTPAALDGIPDTAGGYGYRLSWTVLLNFVCVAGLGLGAWLWRRGRRPARWAGALLVAASLVALVDSAPFLPREISAYEPLARDPADVLCEHADRHGALTFWAHPCATPGSLPHRVSPDGRVEVQVEPYPRRLVTARNYTGFAMFNAGIAAGLPGKEWDAALAEYCAGQRPRPTWAISECDFDEESGADSLAEAQTVVWARDRSAAGILDALRRGRCYATLTFAYQGLTIRDYRLTDGAGSARSGETLDTAAEALTLELRAEATRPTVALKRLILKVILNGQVQTTRFIRAEGAELRAAVAVRPPAGKKSYLRVLVCDNEEAVIALNPIFIVRQTSEPDDR